MDTKRTMDCKSLSGLVGPPHSYGVLNDTMCRRRSRHRLPSEAVRPIDSFDEWCNIV